MLRSGRSFNNVAVGKNNFHTENHIVDFAVFCGYNADTSVSQKSTDCRTGKRRRIMHCSLASFVCHPLQVFVDCTCAALYVHRFFIDVVYFVHSLCIENNTAANRNSAALRTAAAAPGCYGDFIVICDFQYFGNFFCVFGRYNHISLGHSLSPVSPHSGKPVVVYTVSDFVNFSCRTVFFSDCVLKLGGNHIK